jgi:hypothetical protein
MELEKRGVVGTAQGLALAFEALEKFVAKREAGL